MEEGGSHGFPIIESAIRRQVRANIRANLFFFGHPDNITLNADFVEILDTLGMSGDEVPDSLVLFASECAETALYEMNQYLEVGDATRKSMRSLYRETFRMVAGGADPRDCMRFHHRRLASLVSTLYPPHFPPALAESPSIGRVTCGEYSTETIAALHGFDPVELMEPILDVGCGRSAGFVSTLSDMGKVVLGIDRSADGNRREVRRTGWFDFPFETRAWGTVLANMSFSNHMRYHLTNGTDHRDKYFETYMRICGSLKKGGSFRYAPDLPEAERLLNTGEFTVEVVDNGLQGLTAAKITRNGS